jgi:hypothetical protein
MTRYLDDILLKNIHLSPEDILFSTQQSADFLGVKPGTLAVWQCTKRYNLPSVKVGRLRKYRLSDLQAFIQNNAE